MLINFCRLWFVLVPLTELLGRFAGKPAIMPMWYWPISIFMFTAVVKLDELYNLFKELKQNG